MEQTLRNTLDLDGCIRLCRSPVYKVMPFFQPKVKTTASAKKKKSFFRLLGRPVVIIFNLFYRPIFKILRRQFFKLVVLPIVQEEEKIQNTLQQLEKKLEFLELQQQHTLQSLTKQLREELATKQTQPIPVGNDSLLMQTPMGWLQVDKHKVAKVLQLLEHNELYPGMRLLLNRLLMPGNYFIDAHAEEGYFTLLASKCIGEQGHLLALTHSVHDSQLLEANIAVHTQSKAQVTHWQVTPNPDAIFNAIAHYLQSPEHGLIPEQPAFCLIKAPLHLLLTEDDKLAHARLHPQEHAVFLLTLPDAGLSWNKDQLIGLAQAFLDYGFEVYAVEDKTSNLLPVSMNAQKSRHWLIARHDHPVWQDLL